MTGGEIAQRLRLSRATVARLLGQAGLSRLKNLDPKEPPRRYEKERPGELVHLDIKKLGCIRRIGHRITGNRRDSVRGAALRVNMSETGDPWEIREQGEMG